MHERAKVDVKNVPGQREVGLWYARGPIAVKDCTCDRLTPARRSTNASPDHQTAQTHQSCGGSDEPDEEEGASCLRKVSSWERVGDNLERCVEEDADTDSGDERVDLLNHDTGAFVEGNHETCYMMK